MATKNKTSKIIRKKGVAGGGITDAEKARMDEHTRLWIARAMRTAPIEPVKIIPAIKALYAAAGLKEPRVVIVPSPRVLAFAGGFAAGIWYWRKNGNLKDAATDAATYAATRDATDAATYAATDDATDAATDAATYAATDAATRAATDAATRAATYAATDDELFAALALEISGTKKGALFLLGCATYWWRMYQGGNMWAAWDCYLTAARDILGLQLPQHEKYAAWEQCAIHGGFRLMHEEFCMVSDFPEVLRVDEQNRPHCADGASHRWRDGWELYHWHGVRIPDSQTYIITNPERITVSDIENETNAEIRRVMIEKYGQARFIQDSGAKEIHADDYGTLYRKEIAGDEPIVMVKVVNSTPEANGTFKDYFLRVPPTIRTAREAVAWTFELNTDDYAPVFES